MRCKNCDNHKFRLRDPSYLGKFECTECGEPFELDPWYAHVREPEPEEEHLFKTHTRRTKND